MPTIAERVRELHQDIAKVGEALARTIMHAPDTDTVQILVSAEHAIKTASVIFDIKDLGLNDPAFVAGMLAGYGAAVFHYDSPIPGAIEIPGDGKFFVAQFVAKINQLISESPKGRELLKFNDENNVSNDNGVRH